MEIVEIKQLLKDVFSKVFQANDLEITEDLTADKVAKWDSLSHLTMISEVEKVFGIKFKLKELVNMKNVGDLIQMISEKTQ